MRRLRYYRDKFDLERAPRFSIPAEPFEVCARDGVPVRGHRLEGSGRRGFLVVHGLFAHSRAPGFRHIAESLTRYGPAWTIDLRGHGASGGACTLGNLEALDIAAATTEIRRQHTGPVVLVAFSMGAAAAIRSAALHEPADAVVAVSSPAFWRGRRRRSAWRTAAIWRLPGGPALVGALTRVRLVPRLEENESPADLAGRLAPSPLLVVHGTADRFFPPEEARRLLQRASKPKALWLIQGGGHAEGLFTDVARPVDRARVDRFADGLVRRLELLVAR